MKGFQTTLVHFFHVLIGMSRKFQVRITSRTLFQLETSTTAGFLFFYPIGKSVQMKHLNFQYKLITSNKTIQK